MAERTVLVAAKSVFLSRTMLVGVLTVATGTLQLVSEQFQLSPEWSARLLTTLGVLMLILRLLTRQPLTTTSDPVAKEAKAAAPGAELR